MATTTTTNITLVKPDYSEAADVQVLNGNADKIDAAFGVAYNAFGIVVNGNKAALNAATGQFVILKNSTISGRSDGLHTAAKPIPANTAIDSTYLIAVSGGGLNMLQSQMRYMIKYEDHTAADLPSAYSLGLIFTNVGGTTYGFPYGYALVLTFNSGGRVVQCIVRVNAKTKIRSADGDAWSDWEDIVS